jgi:hypothetical protein
MPCRTCDKDLQPRERTQIKRYDVAAQRRVKCSVCDANDGGQCQELGLPVVELTKDWSTQCPRGEFGGIKQSCPECGRANQYLSKSSRCQWCEIDRRNRAENAARAGKRSKPARIIQRSVSDITPVANVPGGCSVVWVYWAGGQRNDELWHSIQLASQNLTDAGEFFICGDVPQWYQGHGIDSPRVGDKETVAAMGDVKYKKWLDSIVKLRRIIDDARVSETFLWLYDDTFIVRPTTIGTLAVPRYSGQLRRSSRSTWRVAMMRTHDALKGAGLPTLNYSTHYPIVFDKQKLQQTIDRFRPDRQPLLIESLYQNQWAKNPQQHAGEFQYTQRVRSGWTPKRSAIVANVGQFNAPARAAISKLITKKRHTGLISAGANVDANRLGVAASAID